MNNYEKYYRRAYKAIERLTEVYKYGYDERKMHEFRNNLIMQGMEKQIVMKNEQLSLMFTATVALLGLNKESIENTGKISKYKDLSSEFQILINDLPPNMKERLDEFYHKRTIETPFPQWLSIIKDLTRKESKEETAADIIKKVRNGLLHSNFYIEADPNNIDYTHINIKSYYEAELFNMVFEMFVFKYFSNLEELGLVERLHTYNIRLTHIKNKEMLHERLKEMSINYIKYNNIKNVGEDTPELILMNSKVGVDVIDREKFSKKLKESDNFENLEMNELSLNESMIDFLERYIDKKFGSEFYKMNSYHQIGIITTQLQFIINPKREVSNWLTHFWYLYSGLTAETFDAKFFSGDEYAYESCYPSLLILKAYLIMYRLQNNNFDKLDYTKLNIDFSGGIKLISGNIKNPDDKTNTFKRTIDKETEKDDSIDPIEIFGKVFCDVVRNSLAHGNINTYFEPDTMEKKIELSDIDQKSGRVRTIRFSLDSFDKFLSSEAFLPKNCYCKDNKTKIYK